MNKFFMGKCSNTECFSKGELTSVRYRTHQDNFFCWQCESGQEWQDARFLVEHTLNSFEFDMTLRGVTA